MALEAEEEALLPDFVSLAFERLSLGRNGESGSLAEPGFELRNFSRPRGIFGSLSPAEKVPCWSDDGLPEPTPLLLLLPEKRRLPFSPDRKISLMGILTIDRFVVEDWLDILYQRCKLVIGILFIRYSTYIVSFFTT